MSQMINPGNGKPRINVDAMANLDIKLEGTDGVAGVGLIMAGLVIIFGLFFKFRP